MKKLLILSIITFFLLSAALFFLYQKNSDTYLRSAKKMNPLGKKQAYIIAPNLEKKDGHDGSIIQPGTYYTFYPVEKNQAEEQNIWGRIISKETQIDLIPFLNQPVYLWGEFKHGEPILIKETTNAGLLLENEVLIIKKIELVK